MKSKRNLRNNRILVIDDTSSVHEDFRKVLGADLDANPALGQIHELLFGERNPAENSKSFQVDAASSGEEGLTMVRTALSEGRPYALAFVDVRMPPGWDGIETVRRIWQRYPELQVVICTAYADYTWERMIQTLGDVDNLAILRKPFEREEVLQLAHLLTRKWEASSGLRASHLQSESAAAQPFTVLILEDELLTRTFIERKLTAALPDVKIFTARNVAEAQTLLANNQIDFFLLDIVVPDGSGIDFLCDVQVTQADAQVVLMTAQELGQYRAAAEELGVLRFLEKPINIDELVTLIRLRRQANDESHGSGSANFAATLTKLTAIDVIQLKCLAAATVALDFFDESGAHGRLYFEGGDIVHAEAGDHSGEQAVADIISWKRGRVEEAVDPAPVIRTIHVGWQGLLLNVVHQVDERNSNSSPEAA